MIESTPENPLAFFDYFFDKEIHTQWKKLYSDYIEHEFGSTCDEINHEDKTITSLDSHTCFTFLMS